MDTEATDCHWTGTQWGWGNLERLEPVTMWRGTEGMGVTSYVRLSSSGVYQSPEPGRCVPKELDR